MKATEAKLEEWVRDVPKLRTGSRLPISCSQQLDFDMHPALLLTEIVKPIIRYGDGKSKSRCAQVCKAWKDDALDLAWYSVDLAIFKRMLGWNEQQKTLKTDPITWQRLYTYADRVRMCTVDSSSFSKAIAEASTRKPLFPRLNQLGLDEIHRRDGADFDCSVFLSSDLRNLITYSSPCSIKLSEAVMACAPQITRITTIFSDINAESTWDALLAGLPDLKHVSLDVCLSQHDILRRCLDVLSEKPFLESLSLDATWSPPGSTLVDLCRYRSLRRLSVRGTTASFDQLWSSRGAIPLQTLDYTLVLQLAEVLDRPFERIVSSFPNATSLKIHVIWEQPYPPGGYKTGGIHLDIGTLAQHTTLTHLDLHLKQPLLMDDDELCALFASWPALRVCSLNPVPIVQPGTQPTLAVLPRIAQHCPLLSDLAFCVTASERPCANAKRLFKHLAHLRLHFADEVAHVRETALFLRALMPVFCAIEVHHADRTNDHPGGGHAAKATGKRSVKRLREVMHALQTMELRYG